MRNNTHSLILFTYEYPYGCISETFLESEIGYLADEFREIIIIPTICNSNVIRTIPKNVTVLPIENYEPSRIEKIKSIFKNIWLVTLILYYQFYIDNKWQSLIKFKQTIRCLALALIKAKKIESLIIKNIWKEYLYYDYWFENSTLTLAILKKRGIIKKCICRAHGSDMYDELWKKSGVPNRSFKVDYFDKIFCVSDYGVNYFKSKIKTKRYSKIALSYLGINQNCKFPIKSENHLFTIVSCSRLVPLKRVSKIVEILKYIDLNIRWLHFGSGELFEEIRKECNRLPSNISWELMGQLSNKMIYDFYENNYIDIFMTMSESEGMPVAIMEAISFGIPIIAANVGGIPEIVNDRTGILVYKDEAPEHIAGLIIKIIENCHFNRAEIIDFFKEKFHAEKNFKEFTNFIKHF